MLVVLGAAPCLHAQDSLTIAKMGRLLRNDVMLPVLIDSAIYRNPEVARINSAIGLAQENLKIARKQVLSAVSVGSSYNYGNTGNLTTGQTSLFTVSRSSFYNLGLGVQLPLNLVLSRKHEIRANEYQVSAAQAEKDGAADYVRQEVIRLYQEMKLVHRLLQISSEARQGARINYHLAERQFQQGDILVSELSRVQDIVSKSNVEFETYIYRFETVMRQLEVLTGVNIPQLIERL